MSKRLGGIIGCKYISFCMYGYKERNRKFANLPSIHTVSIARGIVSKRLGEHRGSVVRTKRELHIELSLVGFPSYSGIGSTNEIALLPRENPPLYLY